MLTTTTFTTSLSGSIARVFGSTVGAFDLHFLMQHGEATVADYLNGSLSRHAAAIELANAWEKHLMLAGKKLRKVLRAEAALAADRYLSYLPA